MRLIIFLAVILAVAAAPPLASHADPLLPDPNSARPIAALDTLFIEEMTWMEVRDAMRAGKDTVIISSGAKKLFSSGLMLRYVQFGSFWKANLTSEAPLSRLSSSKQT